MRRLAGRPVRSLARSLTHSHSLCRNLFRLRTFLLSRRLFLSGENRTHAGRRAGEQAGRVPRCVVPRRARADSAGSGPILKTINGRQAAFSPQKFNSPPSTVVARCSLYRAFLFPPFSVSFRSSFSIVHSSFPRFLSPSVSLNPLLAVFVSLTSRVSSLPIFVTRSSCHALFLLPSVSVSIPRAVLVVPIDRLRRADNALFCTALARPIVVGG